MLHFYAVSRIDRARPCHHTGSVQCPVIILDTTSTTYTFYEKKKITNDKSKEKKENKNIKKRKKEELSCPPVGDVADTYK